MTASGPGEARAVFGHIFFKKTLQLVGAPSATGRPCPPTEALSFPPPRSSVHSASPGRLAHSAKRRALPGTARQFLSTRFPGMIAGLGSAPPRGSDTVLILGIHRLDIKDNRNARRPFPVIQIPLDPGGKTQLAVFLGGLSP